MTIALDEAMLEDLTSEHFTDAASDLLDAQSHAVDARLIGHPCGTLDELHGKHTTGGELIEAIRNVTRLANDTLRVVLDVVSRPLCIAELSQKVGLFMDLLRDVPAKVGQGHVKDVRVKAQQHPKREQVPERLSADRRSLDFDCYYLPARLEHCFVNLRNAGRGDWNLIKRLKDLE